MSRLSRVVIRRSRPPSLPLSEEVPIYDSVMTIEPIRSKRQSHDSSVVGCNDPTFTDDSIKYSITKFLSRNFLGYIQN